MKYVLVTGGVISGVGKGIIASSLGVILQSIDVRVSAIKIDPYINIDAGTFSPYEHGEVFVLNDGAEVDLDLGNYERFLGLRLNADNNITTGKIYQYVINRERRGDYLGKTVQVVPHVTDCIQDWVQRVAVVPVDSSGKEPELCIIELGGTTGDIEGMAFAEAFRQFQFRVKRENFINVHVSLVPELPSTGEQKTKPIQNSVRELRALGLPPDIIICRSTKPLGKAAREKISNFCQVEQTEVISVHDASNIYHVPMVLASQGVLQFLVKRLHLNGSPMYDENTTSLPPLLNKWQEIARRYDQSQKKVRIAVVGKYVKHADAYASVIKALYHAALWCNRSLVVEYVNAECLDDATKRADPSLYEEVWRQLHSADGVLIPGGFGDRGIEGMIKACNYARTEKKPFLGVCLGMQCAVIDFARSVLSFTDANSAEFDKESKHKVIIDMPEHTTGQMGGTMRLGLRRTVFKEPYTSTIQKLYGGAPCIEERHRHRYEVNPDYVSDLEMRGLRFVGQAAKREKELDDEMRMEICELQGHPYFVGVQFHPEYLSWPIKPSPPYLGLILAVTNQLDSYIQFRRIRSGLDLANQCQQQQHHELVQSAVYDGSPSNSTDYIHFTGWNDTLAAANGSSG